MRLRMGYGTNGFTGHRLDEALDVISGLGYDGVALTIDQPHLDPFAADLPEAVTHVAGQLERTGLSCVVETGGRYVLDPWRKHHPTLVSDEGRPRRLDYLRTAVDVAARLDAEVVSFWSGTLPPRCSQGEGRDRLIEGIAELLDHAATRQVRCAIEPEPGMLVETAADALGVLAELGDPDGLGVTLDIGHVVCTGEGDILDVVHAIGDRLWNVQVDDMRPGRHEHLTLGDGEVDLPAALRALVEVDYRGLASVELPRHSHAAPQVAEQCITRLRRAAA